MDCLALTAKMFVLWMAAVLMLGGAELLKQTQDLLPVLAAAYGVLIGLLAGWLWSLWRTADGLKAVTNGLERNRENTEKIYKMMVQGIVIVQQPGVQRHSHQNEII